MQPSSPQLRASASRKAAAGLPSQVREDLLDGGLL
jgi:hypothetical protein